MTALGADLRREDQRTNVRLNPFWVTSALFGVEQTGKKVALIDFPATMGTCFIHEMIVGVKTAFTGGTHTINIGYCTITDESTDLTFDNEDIDQFIATGEITEGTIGYYVGGKVTHTLGTSGPTLGQTGTPWGMAKAIDTYTSGSDTGGDITKLIITGADLAKPCITVDLAAALTAGEARLYVMMSRVL